MLHAVETGMSALQCVSGLVDCSHQNVHEVVCELPPYRAPEAPLGLQVGFSNQENQFILVGASINLPPCDLAGH